MRNLKKLFAVVMIVAMLASMMVPALAAGVEYDDEAGILQDLNLFQGYGAGDLGLEDDLTREQGLALMLRVMGLEEEVKAMTEEEIAEGLAKVTDPETITDTWAKPYVAYAVLNGLTNGIDASTLPNVKFAGQLKMNGQEFINLMLNGMGYRTAWDDVLVKAAEVEILSAGEAVTFGRIKEMKRDQAVAIMYNALTGVTSEGITLAQALVDAGAVDADKMIEYGFIEEEEEPVVEPVELEAEASATNLVQLNVEFNAEVDKESAEDTGNYEIKKVKIADATLQDDGRTVVLTFAWEDARKQQDVVDLVIDGVKDLDGNEMDDYTIEDIEFIDTTIPTAIDAAVVGNDTIKVIFSEPVEGDKENNKLKKGDFSVNNGKLYIKEVRLQNNNTEALVELYNNLKEGEVTLQVKSGTEDFAGFGVIGKMFTLEVVPDEEAPVVIGYEKASNTSVTLLWNEDIELNGKLKLADYYHTNSKNPAKDVEIDGSKMTIEFDDDYKLPNGTAYVYVMKEAVRDLWDNENAQQMIQIEVELDETPPAVDGDIKATDEKVIEIKFTEELDKDSAEDEDNYTILDADGEEIKNIIDKIECGSKKVTITFEEDLSGDYSIAIEDVKDKAGNKIVPVVVDFNVGDTTAPVAKNFVATLYDHGSEGQKVRIFFDDVMETDPDDKYSVVDVEKYVIIDGKSEYMLEDIEDVEIEVVEEGKAVLIYIPSKEDVGDDIDDPESGKHFYDFTVTEVDGEITADQKIQIARVADAAGLKTAVMSYDMDLKVSDSIDIEKVEATARDTIEITFKDELAGFDVDDITITVLDSKTSKITEYTDEMIAGVDTKLKDGKTVVVYTLDDEHLLAPNITVLVNTVKVTVADKPVSENKYGKPITAKDWMNAVDKIKPELLDDNNKDTNYAADKYSYDYEEDAGRFIKDYFALGLKDETTVTNDVYYFNASLCFNEDIEVKGGINTTALIGNDFIVKLDRDVLVNGTDYYVAISETDPCELLFYFKADKVEDDEDNIIGYELEGDLEIELVSKPNYIVDANKNTLAAFDTIEVDDIDFYVEK